MSTALPAGHTRTFCEGVPRYANTIFETSVVKPLLFCTGAMALGAGLAIAQGWWRLLTAEDMDIDFGDDCDLPSLLPNMRGVA